MHGQLTSMLGVRACGSATMRARQSCEHATVRACSPCGRVTVHARALATRRCVRMVWKSTRMKAVDTSYHVTPALASKMRINRVTRTELKKSWKRLYLRKSSGEFYNTPTKAFSLLQFKVLCWRPELGRKSLFLCFLLHKLMSSRQFELAVCLSFCFRAALKLGRHVFFALRRKITK